MSEDVARPYAPLEQRLGYCFRRTALCETALTHTSWINETDEDGREDNERLEFLGDTVLALTVSDVLMRQFPGAREGELSKVRAAIVNESGLALAAGTLGVGQWIFLGRGEELAGGRHKASILSNVLEALIGAVYLDGGMAPAREVVERLIVPRLPEAHAAVDRDFKSRLQELSQARLRVAPRYVVVAREGPDHDTTFEVAIFLRDREFGRARGKSKKEAQQAAAALALGVLESSADAEPPP